VLDKLLKKLLGEKHKVLLFSQFTMLLDLLEDYCAYRGFTFCRLDGSTSLEDRESHMQDFNSTDKYQIFLLSTKAGGLGINLVGADRVIIYDMDWNPQNDIQAMDRAYRIGQTKAVHVYKLITEHTIEQRISEFQKSKLIWDELVIQKGALWQNKRQDPFKNLNLNHLTNLGKGDIFRLEADENPKGIEEILAYGEAKDHELEQTIKQRLQKDMESGVDAKLNIFEEEDSDADTIP
jgi:SWI/SNF-related matrix-associated actin-dependent regulator of chromatin subfamily A member 5